MRECELESGGGAHLKLTRAAHAHAPLAGVEGRDLTPFAARRNAEGISVEGHAKGSAETAILMAPVDAQIKLAVLRSTVNGARASELEIQLGMVAIMSAR